MKKFVPPLIAVLADPSTFATRLRTRIPHTQIWSSRRAGKKTDGILSERDTRTEQWTRGTARYAIPAALDFQISREASNSA